jgi:hypothetical protein
MTVVCFLVIHPRPFYTETNRFMMTVRYWNMLKKITIMIPATPAGEIKKARMEGEFGKFEQTVETIFLDDSILDQLKKTAVCKAMRDYCHRWRQSYRPL